MSAPLHSEQLRLPPPSPHPTPHHLCASPLADPGSPQQPPLAPSLAHFLLLLRDHDLEGLAPSEVLELALQESDAEGRQRNEVGGAAAWMNARMNARNA